MNGEIKIYSEAGKGTTFTLCVPMLNEIPDHVDSPISLIQEIHNMRKEEKALKNKSAKLRKKNSSTINNKAEPNNAHF